MQNFKYRIVASLVIVFIATTSLFAQNTNCFLEDFVPKKATIPISVLESKITSTPTVTVTLTADTLSKWFQGGLVIQGSRSD